MKRIPKGDWSVSMISYCVIQIHIFSLYGFSSESKKDNGASTWRQKM